MLSVPTWALNGSSPSSLLSFEIAVGVVPVARATH